MNTTTVDTRQCPACAETIQAAAVKCRYCGERLDGSGDADAAWEAQIAKSLRGGWRIESRSDAAVTFVRGHRVNHVLHAILSFFSFGLWLPIWALVAIFGGENRKMIRR